MKTNLKVTVETPARVLALISIANGQSNDHVQIIFLLDFLTNFEVF